MLNAPAYHRRHHSAEPAHYDSNFAALFPIFDVLAGSYHRPDGYPATGIPDRPASAREVLLWPLLFHRRQKAEDVGATEPLATPR